MKKLTLSLLIILIAALHEVHGSAGYAVSDSGYIPFRNLRYDNRTDASDLVDIFLPRNHDSSTGMIVFIHGGFWSKGSKSQLPELLIRQLTARGYAVSALNYRLVTDSGNKFPAQLEDVSKAIDFLSLKGDSLGYASDRFALIGVSAGAHLALLYAYTSDDKKRIRTIIDLFGPTDLTDPAVRQNNELANVTIEKFLNEKDPGAAIAREASPLLRLSPQTAVPTLIFHGEADDIVDVSQSRRLHEKLLGMNIKSKLITYPGEKHEIRNKMPDVFMNILRWLAEEFPAK